MSYTDNEGEKETVTADLNKKVINVNDEPSGLLSIKGEMEQMETLKAETGGLSDPDGINAQTFRYQWYAGDELIEGATDPTYRLTQQEVGKKISLTVFYTDNEGEEETVTADLYKKVINVNDKPEFIIGTMTIPEATENVLFEYEVKVKDKDPDSTIEYELIEPILRDMKISKQGMITWTPGDSVTNGNKTFQVRIDDGSGADNATSTHTFTVTVKAINDDPIMVTTNGNEPYYAKEDEPFKEKLIFEDLDSDKLYLELDSNKTPSWLTFSNTQKSITLSKDVVRGNFHTTIKGTPNDVEINPKKSYLPYTITLKVNDSEDGKYHKQLTINIYPKSAVSFKSTPIKEAIYDKEYSYTIEMIDNANADTRIELIAEEKPIWLKLTEVKKSYTKWTLKGKPTGALDNDSVSVTLKTDDNKKQKFNIKFYSSEQNLNNQEPFVVKMGESFNKNIPAMLEKQGILANSIIKIKELIGPSWLKIEEDTLLGTPSHNDLKDINNFVLTGKIGQDTIRFNFSVNLVESFYSTNEAENYFQFSQTVLPKNTISVCWNNDYLTYSSVDIDNLKENVKKTIIDSWQKNSNVKISDWKNCENNSSNSVQLRFVDATDIQYTSSEYSGYDSLENAVFIALKKDNTLYPNTILRAFGHVLGFPKENERRDTFKAGLSEAYALNGMPYKRIFEPKVCEKIKFPLPVLNPEEYFFEKEYRTNNNLKVINYKQWQKEHYDSESIMNYCLESENYKNKNKNKNNDLLTEKDKKRLQQFYGAPYRENGLKAHLYELNNDGTNPKYFTGLIKLSGIYEFYQDGIRKFELTSDKSEKIDDFIDYQFFSIYIEDSKDHMLFQKKSLDVLKQVDYLTYCRSRDSGILNNNLEDKTIFKLGCNLILDHMRKDDQMPDYKYDNRNVNNQYFYYDSMFNFEQLQMISCDVKVKDSEVQTNDRQYTFFSSAELLSDPSNEHCFDFAAIYDAANYSEIMFLKQEQALLPSVYGYYFLFAKGRSFSGMVNGKDSVIFKNGRDPAITITAETKMKPLSHLEGEGTQESRKIYKNKKIFSGCDYDGCFFDGIDKSVKFWNTSNNIEVYIEFNKEKLVHKNIHFPVDLYQLFLPLQQP